MEKGSKRGAKKEKQEERAKGSMEDKETVGDYILMDIIGRGAFGVVWRAVHRSQGNWVAIKRIKLSSNKKKKLQLSSLMMEIDLLKSLQHPNIVHYIEHLLAEETLNIIMEYIENGSLESVLRKHGKFPESLVATYMAQVGTGLAYLHAEGVIHRDIKGANILITTSGAAKLADFGVSTKLEDITNAEDSFAGTPYWMAPEIISMSGATTACDVWSFGCTIIELLTGTPPYGNLPPAASLYRIVQDDHPPLPEGITDALRDLLLLCFQKDVDRRISAEKLLRHPWLRGRKSEDFNVVKEKIKKLEEERKPPEKKPSSDSLSFDFEDDEPSVDTKKNKKPKKNRKKKEMKQVQYTYDSTSSVMSLKEPGSVLGKGSLADLKVFAQDVPTFGSIGSVKKQPKKNNDKKKKESSSEDDWYSDEEDTSSNKSMVINNSSTSSSTLGSMDLTFEEESGTVRVRKLDPKPKVQDLFGSGDSDELIISDSEDEEGGHRTRNYKPHGNSVLGIPLETISARFKETDNDDYDDLDFEEDAVLHLPAEDSQANTESEGEDIFDDVFEFEEEDQGAMLQIQMMEGLKKQVTTWLEGLKPGDLDSEAVVANCEKLLSTFIEQPSIKTQSITNANIIHLLNMLDVYATQANWRILQYILVIINEILVTSPDTKNTIQVNFCLLGGIPAVTKFAGNNYPKAIRLEAAKFINRMTSANPLCLHMFVACGGLSVLVTLLEPNYKTYSTLVKATIEGIWTIFHLQILPKADFCHLFAKSGLLPRLATTLVNVYKDSEAETHLFKLADIFFYFSQASEAAVLDSMCTATALQSIREVVEVKQGLEVKPSYHLLWMLHAISNLSLRPAACTNLEQQGFIPLLVRFLERREEFTKEELGIQDDDEADNKERITLVKIHRWVLSALFNLCQLHTSRQEQVVLAGIIPSLVYFIEQGVVYFLKELAIKIFLDIPHASDKVRILLWRTDSFPVYLRLLAEPLWFVDVLNCLQLWLRVEPDAVTKELGNNVDKLINVLSFARDSRVSSQTFLKSLEPLVLIVQNFPALALMMIDQGVISAILNGLATHKDHTYIRGQLLLILLFLMVHCEDSKKNIPAKEKEKLQKEVKRIAETATGRVKDISAKILASPAIKA